jgi:hypothetical protein
VRSPGVCDRESAENNPIRREMGLGHEELFRILPRAIEERPWSLTNDRITISDPHGVIYIKVFPETTRSLGALRLAVTVLEISFEGLTVSEIDRFMRRFDLSFRRTGG